MDVNADGPQALENVARYDTARNEAFSDAVFAVAMTLLAVELVTPEYRPGELLHALLHQWPVYVSFLASFLYVGVMWMNHHATFTRIRRMDRGLRFANLGILLHYGFTSEGLLEMRWVAEKEAARVIARAISCYGRRHDTTDRPPRETAMKLEGLHHITMITGDARKNVDFYADVLGLRLVKKTVNFDQPDAYHLYFGDERGSPGSILTWFEFAGAARGRPGVGDIHTLQLGVGSEDALGYWADRLADKDYPSERGTGRLRFQDYDGLQLELVVARDGNAALTAEHPEVPAEHAIVGIEGARAYGASAHVEERLLTGTLGFTHLGDGEYRLDGEQRRFHWAYDPPPAIRGSQGAGSVHHIAWGSRDEDHLDWQQRVRDAGGFVTDVRDRDYFQSIYFREPRGILFEIATLSPGFAVDEDPDRLGEELRVPKMHEHLRERLERTLTPVVNPRTARREKANA